MKNNFIVYAELETQTATLSDAQLGQLLRAMFAYNRGEEPALSDPVVSTAFSFVRSSMDRNREKWEKTAQRNRENGKKGGRPPKATPTPPYQEIDKPQNLVPIPVPSVKLVQREKETRDSDTSERDFQDALQYITKTGFTLSDSQKQQLRHWVHSVGFDMVVLAVDRSLSYEAQTVNYVFQILDEWKALGLTSCDGVMDYLGADAVAAF